MTSKQKLIKYAALAFAVFIIVNIALGVQGVFKFLLVGKTLEEKYDFYAAVTDKIDTLSIYVHSADIFIVTGEKLEVATNNSNISWSVKGTRLVIEEDKDFFPFNNDDVYIYLPSNTVFSRTEIKSNIGEVNADSLFTHELSMTLGAGDVHFKLLNVHKNANIKCAAGEFSVDRGCIYNLNMDMSVGDAELSCYLLENSKIYCDVGDINLNLFGKDEDYQFLVKKSIGDVKLNGKNIKDGEKYGNGNNFIEIDGAVGDIDIDIRKE